MVKKQFFPALTGYRAIAAWMIFIYHFMPLASPKYPQLIKNVVSHFHLGVDMFFVLSGFLITYRYFNDHPIHFRKYILNRFARIYPMYFLLTVLAFVAFYLQGHYWDTEKSIEAALSFTMAKGLFAKYSMAGVPQGWTLTLEEMFYFTAPFYFILIRRDVRWLYVLPFLIFGFGVGLKAAVDHVGNPWGFLGNHIAAYIFEFFSGIGLGYFLLKRGAKTRNFTYFGLAVIALYLVGKSPLEPIVNFKAPLVRATELLLISALGIAPLLYGLITEKTLVQKLLSSRLMVLLGKSSYIFYLIHKGAIPDYINNNIIDNKLAIFILLNMISVLMFRYVEEPLNLYIRNKFSKN